MFRTILIYGTIAGIVVGLPTFAISVATAGQPLPYGMAIGYLTMLVALSAVFVGVKRHRDGPLGGVIGFWPALGLGLAISLVAGLLYVIAWELAVSIIGIDFLDHYTSETLAQQRADGASPAALAKTAAEMAAFKASYASPLVRMPMTLPEILPVGILVSLVSAGLLRNPRFLPGRIA